MFTLLVATLGTFSLLESVFSIQERKGRYFFSECFAFLSYKKFDDRPLFTHEILYLIRKFKKIYTINQLQIMQNLFQGEKFRKKNYLTVFKYFFLFIECSS